MVIRVKENKLEHFIEFRHFITIVAGDSGTGKTRMYNIFKNRKTLGLIIECERSVYIVEEVFNSGNAQSWFSKNKGSVIIADEIHKEILSDGFFRLAKRNGCNIVIFTRSLKEFNVEFGIDSNLVLEYTSTGSYTKPRFTFSKSSRYTDTVVEDERSGFDFYKIFIPSITSGSGASNISKQITEEEVRYKRFIVDGAAFGKYIDNCYRAYLDGCVDIAAPESLEWLLLYAPTFDNCTDLPDRVSFPENYGANYTKYSTWENYYTELLETVMLKCGLGNYVKKVLPDFATTEYKAILERTGYDYLIDNSTKMEGISKDDSVGVLSMLDSIFG